MLSQYSLPEPFVGAEVDAHAHDGILLVVAAVPNAGAQIQIHSVFVVQRVEVDHTTSRQRPGVQFGEHGYAKHTSCKVVAATLALQAKHDEICSRLVFEPSCKKTHIEEKIAALGLVAHRYSSHRRLRLLLFSFLGFFEFL